MVICLSHDFLTLTILLMYTTTLPFVSSVLPTLFYDFSHIYSLYLFTNCSLITRLLNIYLNILIYSVKYYFTIITIGHCYKKSEIKDTPLFDLYLDNLLLHNTLRDYKVSDFMIRVLQVVYVVKVVLYT